MWLTNPNYIHDKYPLDENELFKQHPIDMYKLAKKVFYECFDILIKEQKAFDISRRKELYLFEHDWAVWIAKINRVLLKTIELKLSDDLNSLTHHIYSYVTTLNTFVRTNNRRLLFRQKQDKIVLIKEKTVEDYWDFITKKKEA